MVAVWIIMNHVTNTTQTHLMRQIGNVLKLGLVKWVCVVFCHVFPTAI